MVMFTEVWRFLQANPSILMWIVTGMYAAQALLYFLLGKGPQALMLGGYALANIGLIKSVTMA